MACQYVVLESFAIFWIYILVNAILIWLVVIGTLCVCLILLPLFPLLLFILLCLLYFLSSINVILADCLIN